MLKQKNLFCLKYYDYLTIFTFLIVNILIFKKQKVYKMKFNPWKNFSKSHFKCN